MTKKILFIVAFTFSFLMNAQTDEASGAPALAISTSYACENQVTGTFEGFTKSNEFTCPTYDNWVDAWYTITPSETGIYALKIEELTNNQNVRLGFYSGTPGNLTSLTGCATRYLNTTLTAGTTYYINVRGASTSVQYFLCAYHFPNAPTNDEPINSDTIEASTYDVCENAILGYTASASHSSEVECSTSNPDVWYSFTPNETTEYTFKASLVNGTAPLYLGIYSGTPGFLNAFTASTTSPTIQCQDIIMADLVAGETYYISVTSSLSSQAIYFELCAYKSPDAPSNDDCSTPIALTVGTTFENSYLIATNTSASVNPANSNFPDCGTLDDFGIYGRDVWFSVVVPPSGNFTVETRLEPTETNLTDTVMETYTGSCGTETLLPYSYDLPAPNVGTAFCNDQLVIGGNQFAGINFTNKTPGETVLVRVWGWSYQFGKFRIAAYDSSSLGTEEFDTDAFSYFPNPTDKTLNIQYTQAITKVTVYNTLGQVELFTEPHQKKISLDVSLLTTGIYFVKVDSNNNTSTNFKIVKN